MPDSDFILFPAVIAIDTREQLPYQFCGLKADAKHGKRPLIIRTVRTTLASGDYSLVGLENHISIERKSLSDAFSSFGKNRDRFERELDRLNQIGFAAVVIEADWTGIFNHPPRNSLLSPKAVLRSIIAWQQRYTHVHWWPTPSRAFAERLTFRILERFYRDYELKEAEREKKMTKKASTASSSSTLAL